MNGEPPYYLGCYGWSCRDWIGSIFPPTARQENLLREYARVFNAVEGGTLFYALPPLATLERWMAETSEGFRFAPKFPKAITHERRLSGAREETAHFLRALEALEQGGRLGVSFLQLPPSFNIHSMDALESYLKSLPQDFPFAVEPRHISWYDQADNEKRLHGLLEELGMDLAIFDTRPIFSAPPDDAEEREAQASKPQTPIRKLALGRSPMLRFVGRNTPEKNDAWIREWAPVINKWILEGRKPYVFAHAANDACAPYVARRIHEQLRKLNPLLRALPPFESDRPAAENREQLDLF